METISYTMARAQLAQTMQHVCDDHQPIIITRSNNTAVVMISIEDYSEMEATAYLLKSPANAERLTESIDEIEKMIRARKTKKNRK